MFLNKNRWVSTFIIYKLGVEEMRVASVVENLDFMIIKGDLNSEVSSVAYDSRDVISGSVFVAITGFKVDGHQYIKKAIELGATTIICEKDVVSEADITILKVDDTRKALARVSANFYQNPTEKLNLIGITGTNGKTSTTYFIQSIFEQAKKSIGLIGTIGTIIKNQVKKNKNTTPESLNLQQIFSEMVEVETENCIMEVSSHALSLKRVAYSNFNTAIFTNLTPDHLELHGTMEEYFLAKAELFQMATDFNIINIDDEYGKKLVEKVKEEDAVLLTYGLENNADVYPTNIEYGADFTSYTVNTPSGSIDVKVNIPGVIYVYNSLAAIACAYCNNISLEDIQTGINSLEGIKGRLEVVYKEDDYKIVIDFAHTEDGLEKALSTLKPHVKGRMILVFGVYAAPGEDGRDKRVAMGRIAANYADIAIVTSDNPKDQDPNAIIDEIVEAIEAENGEYQVYVDRKEAIERAVEMSESNDIILIAGKGHETSQIIGNKEIPFNESEIVLNAINNRKQLVG
jgi:UDP-N-acetylmuramoyl-L-alanyl-D-glutamate--2,6-diaminopimelate ligase